MIDWTLVQDIWWSKKKKIKGDRRQRNGTGFLAEYSSPRTTSTIVTASSGCRCLWGTHVGGYAKTRYRVGHGLCLPIRKTMNVEERQDPLDLSFWSFFTFLHHGIEDNERHLLWKFYQKNSKEKLVKRATEVARLHKVSIQSCTQKRPSPKVQSRSGDWIWLFYRIDYLYETWHTCSSCSWLQKVASDF